MSKSSDSDLNLADFLTTFDATELGEGDPIAGANLLAAMAITLGNLAKPGAGIQLPSGRLLPVHTNLLATGSLISSLVTDEVMAIVGRCQDNLLAQLTRLLRDDAAEQAKETPRQWALSKGPTATRGEKALFHLMTRDPDFPSIEGTREGEWVEVLAERPAQRLEDLVQHPRAFIASHKRGELEKLLPNAHLGDALIAFSLTGAKDASAYGDLCPPLMDGLFPGGTSGQLVRGRLLVTDHLGALREVARKPTQRNCWLSRLIWLVEGDIDPNAPALREKSARLIKLPDLTNRFVESVRMIIANRLNSDRPSPLVYEIDISTVQTRWMKFLRSMEGQLPGISGTAKTLLPCLTFGLLRLAYTSNRPKNFRFQDEGAEAFARFLIQRMASARKEMLWSIEQARRIELKKALVAKLADGTQSARRLTRRFHRLPLSQCSELLIELQEEGVAESAGGQWRLTNMEALRESESSPGA